VQTICTFYFRACGSDVLLQAWYDKNQSDVYVRIKSVIFCFNPALTDSRK